MQQGQNKVLIVKVLSTISDVQILDNDKVWRWEVTTEGDKVGNSTVYLGASDMDVIDVVHSSRDLVMGEWGFQLSEKKNIQSMIKAGANILKQGVSALSEWRLHSTWDVDLLQYPEAGNNVSQSAMAATIHTWITLFINGRIVFLRVLEAGKFKAEASANLLCVENLLSASQSLLA